MWVTYPVGPKERVEPLEAPPVSAARALAKLINIKLLIMTFSSHSDSQRSIRRVGGGWTSCFVVMLLGERVGAHQTLITAVLLFFLWWWEMISRQLLLAKTNEQKIFWVSHQLTRKGGNGFGMFSWLTVSAEKSASLRDEVIFLRYANSNKSKIARVFLSFSLTRSLARCQRLRFNSGLRNCTAKSHKSPVFFCFSLNTPHGAYCQDMCKENIHSHCENQISANQNIWVRALRDTFCTTYRCE